MNRKVKHILLAWLGLCLLNTIANAQTTLMKEGSVVIDMGVSPQTEANALKPYGLVYSLISNYYTPVFWAINPSKAKDGVDFTVDGLSFSGGPFVIPKDYLTPEVQAEIALWEAKGVVTYTTQSDKLIPVYRELEFFAQWALDAENAQVAVPYLEAAEIPISAYSIVDPANLGICNDLYIMPHADPTWATHENLYDWNNTEANGGFRGWIWASCHAVSVMEALVDPNDPTRRMNFLADDPSPVPGGTGYSLIDYNDHANESGNTAGYQTAFPTDPFMQFKGFTYGAHSGGSERIFLPNLNGGWRSTTRIAAWDPNHPDVLSGDSPGEAAMIAFGHAFGDANRGQVMYEGGHRLDNGTDQENVAAIRAFFNFSFDAPQNKKPTFTDNSFEVPLVVAEGETIDFSVDAEAFPGLLMDTIIWVSNTDGEFVTSQSGAGTQFIDGTATFTAPDNLTEDITAIVTAISQDDCGRVSILKWTFTVLSEPLPPVAVNDDYSGYEDQFLTFNALTNDTDPNNDIDPTTIVTTSPLVIGGVGEFIDKGNGNFTFVPAPGFTGDATLTYQVSDETGLTSNEATITVTIEAAPISCTGDFNTISFSQSTINAIAATGDAKDPGNAVGSTPGTHAEVAAGEILTLELAQNAPANYSFTVHYDVVKKDNDLQIELLAADGVTVVQDFGSVTATDGGSNSYLATSDWRYVRFTQLGSGKDAKADVEYIEAVELTATCIDDRDGDLIDDLTDLDDDNDGILDSVEGCIDIVYNAANATFATPIVSRAEDLENAYDGINGLYARLRDNNSEMEVELYGGSALVSGMVIDIYALKTDNNAANTITVSESTDGVNFTNPQVFGFVDDDIYENLQYTLTSDATDLRISFQRSNGDIRIDNISFETYVEPCTGAPDTDEDGVPDYLDLDSDNDGIPDNIEAQATLAYVQPEGDYNIVGVDFAYGSGLTPVDSDNDGTPDYRDTNSDNEDGDDNAEAVSGGLGPIGTIGANGLGSNFGEGSNYIDVNGNFDNSPFDDFQDSDGDLGAGGDVDFRDGIVGADTDGDGILDDVDADDDNDGILDIVEGDTDSDGDGVINRLDLDSDGDGIPDNIEAQTTLGYIAPGTFTDTDGDGVNDVYDGNNGGVTLVPVNTDSDALPDYLDTNSDNKTGNDTVEGGINLSGNVLPNGMDSNVSNGTYLDVNGVFGDDQTVNWPDEDGDVLIGGDVDWRDNITGIDSDGDGIFDEEDIDDDNDGILDTVENNGGNPLDDEDIDGNYDYLDPDATGFVDSNNDGIDDTFDTDLDGIIDQYDLDSDNDGIPDIVEAGGVDNDSNGIVDGVFADNDQDGWSDVFDSDDGGVALADPDSDGDGLEDRLDLDSDNDGIPDVVEAQGTVSYIAATGLDLDFDGIDNAFDPDNGGFLLSEPVNTDGTGDPDYLDLDSDDDGTFDIVESGSGLTAGGNGRTTGTVGANGLDNAIESIDDYSDPDGNINSPAEDLEDQDNDAQFDGDVDYRDDLLNTPGGVDACLSLWVRADKGGTSWTSFSGNGVTLTQNGSVTAGTLINYNAANDFQGGYYASDLSINTSTVSELTVFAIYQPDVTSTGAVWGENDGGFDRYLADEAVSTGTAEQSVEGIYNTARPQLATIILDEDLESGSMIYQDGELKQSFTANHGPESSNNLQLGAIGDGSNVFDGRIAEVIVFCQALDATSRKEVESYLALKYGITLFNSPVGEGDYVASNGTTVWDGTANQAYHHNVAGIIRDDQSIFEQKQSTSSNEDAILTIGLDDAVSADGLEESNEANDGAFSNDYDALVWGHDNADINGGPGSVAETEYDPLQVNARLNREWKVQETGETGTVILRFDVSGLLGPDNMVGTSDESQIVLLVDADGDFSSGASVVNQSFTVDSDGFVVFQANLPNGYFFTLGSSEIGSLPIKLISFTGRAKSNAIELEWRTASEENNSRILIERSADGYNFEEIGSVAGNGTTNAVNDYSFLDFNPHIGNNYYRLVDIDNNGNRDESELISVYFEATEVIQKVYPNPAHRGDKVRVELANVGQQLLLEVYSASGVKANTSVKSFIGGVYEIDTHNLSSGLYLIKIKGDRAFKNFKFFVK